MDGFSVHFFHLKFVRSIVKDKLEEVVRGGINDGGNALGTRLRNEIECAVNQTCRPEQPITPEVARQRTIQQFLKTKQCPNCDLSKLNLRGLDLNGADLSGANLSGSDLSGVNLSGAYLRGSNLSGADLSNSRLSNANLKQADLTGADLHATDLSAANLSGAILTGVDLGTAIVTGASLRGATLPNQSEPSAINGMFQTSRSR